ncbi:MAG: nitroreductase [Sarcina sp.]|nr:nitroreductase [Sarcina sp.]
MEFREVIFGRRSIRKYTDEPVSNEDLQYILDCGLSAPSGVNFQPWYFVAIRSKEQMERLCQVMSDSSDKLHDNLTERFKSHPEVAKESLTFIRKLGGAPVVILAFRHKPSYTKTDDTIVQSVSAALENMALAAVDRGLGSCWMTAPIETADDLRLQEMFAPERGRMVALMTIGHPAQTPLPVARKTGRYIIL